MSIEIKKVPRSCPYNMHKVVSYELGHTKHHPLNDYYVYEDGILMCQFAGERGERSLTMKDRAGRTVSSPYSTSIRSPSIKAIKETYENNKHNIPTDAAYAERERKERERREQDAKQKKIRETKYVKEHYAEQMYDFLCANLDDLGDDGLALIEAIDRDIDNGNG
jgi:hypothetical protein